jgi:hypothetical protein
MNVVTFEIQQPVQEVCPQWIRFIHKVNAIADADAGIKPFGNTEREYQDGDLYIELYAEASLTHAKRDNGTEEGVGVLRFEALTDRVRDLFAGAASHFGEANKQLINGKHWGPDRHAGDYYARKQAKAADASRKLARAADAGDESAVRNAKAELEMARYVGD